ncbi:MAG: ATP-binding protein [Candidatus Saccharibacteria bacterium]
MSSPNTTGQSVLGLHEGEMYYRLARTYPTLALMLVEAVQNAIDADATRVFVGVDLVENRIAILDNGSGVTVEKFHEALQSVGFGIKEPGSLGRFGIGLISPLDKCQSFWFVSRPQGEVKVNAWQFEVAKIRPQRTKATIPDFTWDKFTDLPDPFKHAHNDARIGKRDEPITWNTMVLLDRVTKDKVIGLVDPDEIENLIRSKLGIGMRRKGTHVTLVVRDWRPGVTQLTATDKPYVVSKRQIDPLVHKGQKLDVVRYETEAAGTIEFDLYRARQVGGKRQGQVVVSELGDDSTVTMPDFCMQAGSAGYYNTKDHDRATLPETSRALETLLDGFFEGTVRCENIELLPNRTSFEYNETLKELYLYFGIWYESVGKELMGTEREARAEKRYQDLGEKSLKRLIDELTSNTDLALLARSLRGVLPGMRASRPEPKEKKENSAPRDKAPKDPNSRKVVVRPRQPAESSAKSPVTTFITYAYEMLRGSGRLWEYDIESGVLTFNIRHPLWVKVDEINGKHTPKTDLQVMKLQEYLTLKLLLLLANDDGVPVDSMSLELARVAIDRELQFYIPWAILR